MTNLRLIIDAHVRAYIHECFSTATRYTVTFDDDLNSSVSNSGRPYNPDSYPTVRDFLGQHADASATHFAVLGQALSLIEVHGKSPSTAMINDALRKLGAMPMDRFLAPPATDLTSRESRVRRQLRAMGFLLRKSRRRDPRHFKYGCFDVVDATTGKMVFLPILDIDGIEAWMMAGSGPTGAAREVQLRHGRGG